MFLAVNKCSCLDAFPLRIQTVSLFFTYEKEKGKNSIARYVILLFLRMLIKLNELHGIALLQYD